VNLLAIDTSTDHAAIALMTANDAILVAETDPSQRHGRRLIPAIDALLKSAGLAVADLDFLAVGLGPGSYTGLRIGLTAAKTLAYATGKPMLGFDSLEAIAQNASTDDTRVTVLADAQRGDVYVAEFARPNVSSGLLRIAATRVEPFVEWSARLSERTLVLGPALGRARDLPPLALRAEDPSRNRPDGRQIVGLALNAWHAGRRDDPWYLEPLYLRRSAAEDQWEARNRAATIS
jgi:tRNA threonylcarbamoyladenosine biosynthesis protein TsaB